MTAAEIAARCEKASSTGPNSWHARCPAHLDRSPSLSITEASDGRVLIHCFAGCEPLDVLSVIGLSFSDVFPEPLSHYKPRIRNRIPATALAAAISRECLIIAFIAEDISEGINDPDLLNRAHIAAERIRAAIGAFND